MKTPFYPAIVHKEPDSDFGISFPDFPGCVSVGETMEEALSAGADALQFHIEGLLADSEQLPSPILIDADGGVVMLVTAGKSQ